MKATILILLSFLIVNGPLRGGNVPPAELVLTIPVETEVGVPGFRDAIQVWTEMIRGAKKSLLLEQFYITDAEGEPLRPILNEIAEAGRRGVQVRLIADSKFFKTYPQWVTEVGNFQNAEARAIDFSPGVQHAKFFIVDQSQVFIGSHNFDWRALKHIHEVGIRVTSPEVASRLVSVFEMDWTSSVKVSGGVPAPAATFGNAGSDLTGIRVLASPQGKTPKGLEDSLEVILEKIIQAKRSISIQLYEYSTRSRENAETWLKLDEALRAAGKKGVKVRMILDATALKKDKSGIEALAAQENVEIRLTTIPMHSTGPIDYARLVHSKYLVIDDDTSWVGTENWSRGYFENCRNVGLVVTDSKIARGLRSIFTKLWSSSVSKPVTAPS